MSKRNRTLQQTLRGLHLWLGLIGGILIVMMGLTGVIAVFRPVIENAMAPRVPSRGSFSSLAPVELAFAGAHPAARMTRVTIPEQSPGLILIQADTRDKQHLEIYFDAASGRELGPRRTVNWIDWIVDLHQNLLMGNTGRSLTGIIGFALLFSAISGLLAWLAGPRERKRGIAPPSSGPWRRTNYELHRWAGLWVNALLLVVAFTGIVLAYPDSFQQTVRFVSREPRLTQASRTIRTEGKASQHTAPLDDYVRAAITAVPGGIVRELRMSSRGSSTVSVYLWAPGDIRPKGGHVVLLDRASAAVLSMNRSAEAPISQKLVELANAIHKSEVGGLAFKLPWSLLGLLPLLFFVSGAQIWWGRRRSLLRLNQRLKESGTALAASARR